VLEDPLFVRTIDHGGVVPALKILDANMQEKGLDSLISNKVPNGLIGKKVDAGMFFGY
jgi:hypothetical protein